VEGSNPSPGPLRKRSGLDFLRKLAAVVLVLVSVTIGIIGLMFATEGGWWGIGLIALTPFGIWLATRVTPEGGTTGYFDKNI
jgi:hypothetical protein